MNVPIRVPKTPPANAETPDLKRQCSPINSSGLIGAPIGIGMLLFSSVNCPDRLAKKDGGGAGFGKKSSNSFSVESPLVNLDILCFVLFLMLKVFLKVTLNEK